MVLGPVVFVAVLLYAAYFKLPEFLPATVVYVLIVLVIALAALFLSQSIVRILAARENEIARQRRELTALNHVSEAVSASTDLVEILSRALDAVLELTHAAAGRVWLVDPDSKELRNTVHRGLFPDAFAEPLLLKMGDGVAGRVAASGLPELIQDLERSLDARGFVEMASVPLVAKERVVGVIDVAARHRGEIESATLGLLTSIGRAVGLAIENARLFDAVRLRQADAENLYKAGIAVSSKLDVNQVLNTVTERGRKLLNVEASALCLWDDQKRWLVVGSESGPAEAFESPVGLGRRVAQKIGLLRVDAAHHDDDCITCALIRAPYRQTHMEMPVRVGEQVIGCLCVSSAKARTFNDGEIQTLNGLADQAAVAIQNARAYDRAGNAAITMERERLAREMHDTLAQVLGFVNTKALALREMLDTDQIQAAREQVDQLSALSQELYADVREVILGLRAAISPEKSLLPTLGEYVQAYTRQSGIDAQLVVEECARELSFAPAIELQLIRIVQESLTNIRKHAQAKHAVVRFGVDDGHAEMRIEDDGRGFDPARIARGDWPQFGLQTMRERAESVGGAFVVVSKPSVGTQIVVQIPFGHAGGR
ncbi:MAG: GAF domain-containing protein [Chloroflexi bacterium]|nr:GAF domain-containing protein [Chloroflexota bacterium]